MALDSRMGSNGLLEAEIEWSKQSQPNVPGLSLLGAGAVLPQPDPKLNLNRQAWSQPTVFEGLTGSLRYTHALSDQWQWSAHLGSQRLKTDDRIAFPFGCTDSNGIDYYADRFCPNGDVDVYDFRSEGERRRKQATQFKLDGSFATGNVSHDISLGFLQSAARVKTPDQVFNYSGSLNLANPLLPIPASPQPAPGTANDQRESTRELFANHRISWSPAFKTWFGLRHTRLQRSDALNATDYSQSFTTPWLAAAYDIQGHTLYASHGHGIESEVVASVNTLNPGQALQPKRSRQTEIGFKFNAQSLSWQATLFQISRPVTSADACGSVGISPCNVQLDGSAEHRGFELSAQKSLGALQLGGSATWLDAQRQGSTVDPSINGRKPVNVPSHILRLNAAYRFSQQWQASLHASHEGRRAALPDNTISLPAWTRLDASLKWSTATQGINTTWQLSIDNLLDKRFFKESPYQFGHAYLFPAAPRSLRLLASFAL
ncbi:MAG: TonB-dependent receptor [Brachymonas sp.]|nr:TonB-dependent receptor [Brachymonas sp.]